MHLQDTRNQALFHFSHFSKKPFTIPKKKDALFTQGSLGRFSHQDVTLYRKKREKNWLTRMGIYEQELIQQRS